MNKTNMKKIECIKNRFKCITGIDVKSMYLKAGKEHKNNVKPLNTEHQCVYMFFSEKLCLKVGYVDQGSPQRWTSHHYTAPRIVVSEDKNKEKTLEFPGSTLPRFIMLDNNAKNKFVNSANSSIDELKDKFKELCSDKLSNKDTKEKMKKLSSDFRTFIENNTYRIEFSIPQQTNTSAIKLLEAIAIFVLNPAYEGKSLSSE